jgi:hypothetical protein
VSRHRWFLGLLALLGTALGGFVAEGRARTIAYERSRMPELRALVSTLGLTEARYTRHPSQADFFTAFQSFPGALEHFPAGSVVFPPPHLRPPAAR